MTLFLHRMAAAALLAFEILTCLTSVAVLIILAAGPLYVQWLPFEPQPWQWATAFLVASGVAVAASWTKGIFDKRLPARFGGEPRHAHISGWSFVWIVLATAGIVALASWAATSDTNKATIRTDWGEIILFGVAGAFVVAALIPTLNLAERASGLIAFIGRLISPFGGMLSVLDSIVVFAVAGAAGATQPMLIIRYATLLGTLGACATMGYWLEPPWGLIPLAWGFVVAIAVSRRWAWIETDRELAMLNRRFAGKHLRIGFAQDLRDETLLGFVSLLFLAPLALRQAQIAAIGAHFDLFNVDLARAEDLRTWIGFFGTELAKALPFVDWAEVYDVGGSDDSIIRSEISQHFVFGLRILVDFVFIAALLQALSISARNATQRGLFYEGQLDRLDPFIEPREFRKLLRRTKNGTLEPNAELVRKFPPYDPIRLSELAGESRDKTLRMIANVVRLQQGGTNIDEFHKELSRRALSPDRDKAAILEVVHAIRAAGSERNIGELDQLRRKLNKSARMMEVRTEVIRLIAEAPDSQERTDALMSALEDERDNLHPVRVVAFTALAAAAARGDLSALATLAHAQAAPKLSADERRHAREALRRIERAGQAVQDRHAPVGAAPAAPATSSPALEAAPPPPRETAPEPPPPPPIAPPPPDVVESPPPQAAAAEPERQPLPTPGPAPRRQVQRKGAPVGAILGVVALVAIAVAAFMFWQRLAPPASQPAPIPAPEAAAPPPPPPPNFRDCAECPEMMRLAGGSFLMGAPAGERGRNPWEGPQHEVSIAPFAIGMREVTLAEWDACVAAGGCNAYTPADRGWGRGARPALSVSWQDAQAYVRWLSERTGRAYRLPSEAEWEFAARAGATSAYWWGDEFEAARVSIGRTGETGALGANAFGLFDVTGNVAEWVEDCYVNTYASAPSDGAPVLTGDCSRRVVRGGSWRDSGDGFRIAARSRVSRSVRDSAIGFRVAAAP